MTIHKQTVMIHPILDQYYSYDPSHARSAAYAADKGLVSTALGVTNGPNANEMEALTPVMASGSTALSPTLLPPRLDSSVLTDRLQGV